MSEKPPALQMRGITKRFPGVVANRTVDFEARSGEVHGLLGENGAGKTTLVKILYGLYSSDEGEILLEGERIGIRSPRDAIRSGIGMVHQEFRLVLPNTVLENIILGLDGLGFLPSRKQVRQRVQRLVDRYGMDVDLDAKVWRLSAGERQRVEILRLLVRDSKVLVLDEPTSVLTPLEADQLFATLRLMADEGRVVILITHKLDEVMRATDRVTILRDGSNVATVDTSETTRDQLAQIMVGRPVLFTVSSHEHQTGAPLLEVRNLHATNDVDRPALEDISLQVRQGEILGIAGVAGNGQRELVESIVGLRTPRRGSIEILGTDADGMGVRERRRRGLGFIPEDRRATGSSPNLTVAENLVLTRYDNDGFSGRFFLNDSVIVRQARELVTKYGIDTPSITSTVRTLSGGNLQKLILARTLESNPRVLVASNPTRGLDVGATEYVRKALLERKRQGMGILWVSEDLEELLMMSDRIGVLYQGRLVDVKNRQDTDRETLGRLMLGLDN